MCTRYAMYFLRMYLDSRATGTGTSTVPVATGTVATGTVRQLPVLQLPRTGTVATGTVATVLSNDVVIVMGYFDELVITNRLSNDLVISLRSFELVIRVSNY